MNLDDTLKKIDAAAKTMIDGWAARLERHAEKVAAMARAAVGRPFTAGSSHGIISRCEPAGEKDGYAAFRVWIKSEGVEKGAYLVTDLAPKSVGGKKATHPGRARSLPECDVRP